MSLLFPNNNISNTEWQRVWDEAFSEDKYSKNVVKSVSWLEVFQFSSNVSRKQPNFIRKLQENLQNRFLIYRNLYRNWMKLRTFSLFYWYILYLWKKIRKKINQQPSTISAPIFKTNIFSDISGNKNFLLLLWGFPMLFLLNFLRLIFRKFLQY